MFLKTAEPSDWTNSGYPDIRGLTYHMCSTQTPKNSLLYICDPDRILNVSHLLKLNEAMQQLAVGTPCPCQRRSQCSSGDDAATLHGFVVSIALADNLQMNFHSPSEQQLTDRAESFVKTLEGRWALGDCGNSVIVFVWRHYKKMIIWPARLAERYITPNERKDILNRVNDLIQTDRWPEALTQVVDELHAELRGDPDVRFDSGTLSLVVAVGVASAFAILVTCCIFAFRCCGKYSPEDDKSLSRMDSIRTQRNMNHASDRSPLSLNASPKFPIRHGTPPNSPLSFLADCDTTMV